jgi:arylsulfatase A-like enzyme
VFPTLCEIAGAQTPKGLDGISFLPTLTGKGEQKTHDFLYWEFHEGGTKQAVRYGNWKAIRLVPNGPLELYNVAKDIGEKTNVAKDNPEVVAKIETYLKTARSESKDWPIREPKKK